MITRKLTFTLQAMPNSITRLTVTMHWDRHYQPLQSGSSRLPHCCLNQFSAESTCCRPKQILLVHQKQMQTPVRSPSRRSSLSFSCWAQFRWEKLPSTISQSPSLSIASLLTCIILGLRRLAFDTECAGLVVCLCCCSLEGSGKGSKYTGKDPTAGALSTGGYIAKSTAGGRPIVTSLKYASGPGS